MTQWREATFSGEKSVRVPGRLVVLFARQMATLLANGVPLLQSLETLQEQPDCPQFGEVIQSCAHDVSSGHRFSNSMRNYPSVFPRVFLSMAEIGEQTGGLDAALDQLASWMERDLAVTTRVRSALNYPLFVLAVSVALVLLIFYKVMPGFVGIFREMNIPLPLVTRVVMGLTEAIQTPWFWIACILVGGGLYRLAKFKMSTLEGRASVFGWLHLMPIIGPLVQSAGLARYCMSIATLMSSGMPLLKVFDLSAQTCGDPIIEIDGKNLLQAIREGEPISEHMSLHTEIYGETTVMMLNAGEESSRIPEMMKQAAAYYDLDMNSRIDGLSAAIEPLLLGGVGSLVGTIVISVFLPMYSYIGNLSH